MSNDVSINVKTNDQSSATMEKIAGESESMSERAGKAITGLGQKIGGEFGELVSMGGEKLEELGEHGLSANQKLGIMGAGIAGIGVALMGIGSAEKAASQQLDAAVEASGQSISDYSKQIDAAKSKAEDFGHSGADADQALAKLDETTGDLSISLKYMGLVDDLAAAKHESLASAATQVSAVLGGNTKLLKQYGIDLGTGAHSADELAAGLQQVSDKLQGQASAASDTFIGKLQSIKEHAEGAVASFANEFGPEITGFGTVVTLASGVVDIFAARSERLEKAAAKAAEAQALQAKTALDEAAANTAAAVSEDALAASTEEATVAQDSQAVASKGGAAGAIGVLAAFTAAAYAAQDYAHKLGNVIDGENNGIAVADRAADASKDLAKAIEADGGAFGKTSEQFTAASLATNSAFAKTKVSVADLTTAIGQNDDQFNQTVGTWVKAGQITFQQAETLKILHTQFDKTAASVKTTGDAVAGLDTSTSSATSTADSATYVMGGLDDVIVKAGTDAKGTAAQFSSFNDILDSIAGNTLSAKDAQDKFDDGLVTLKSSLDKTSKSVDGNTQAARTNREALDGQVEQAISVAQAQYKQSGSVDQASASLQANISKLEAAAVQSGLTKSQVDALLASYKLTPGNINTVITANIDDAWNKLTTIQDKLATLGQLANTDVADYLRLSATINPYAQGVNGGGSAYDVGNTYGQATGGIVGAARGGIHGGRRWVGEHGPELVDLPVGSHVNSNPDSMSKFGSGGAPAVTLELAPSGVSGLEAALLEYIRKAVRVKGGGSVQNAFGSS